MNESKPGRELDRLIAEKVMGWKSNHGVHLFPPADEPNRKRFQQWNGETMVTEIPHYSTDIAAAWEVKEEMRKRGWKWQLSENAWNLFKTHPADPDAISVVGKSDSHAICLAALKAVGGYPIHPVPAEPGT